MNNEIPEGISVVKPMKKPKYGPKGINWLAVKEDYLINPTVFLKDLAVKYGVGKTTIMQKSTDEGWVKQRMVLQAKVGKRSEDIQVEKLAMLNARHALIGKFLQKSGIEPIKRKQVHIRSAKTALEFVTEGVRIEREAEGIDRQQPQVVNIIAQQQGIIDKYAR